MVDSILATRNWRLTLLSRFDVDLWLENIISEKRMLMLLLFLFLYLWLSWRIRCFLRSFLSQNLYFWWRRFNMIFKGIQFIFKLFLFWLAISFYIDVDLYFLCWWINWYIGFFFINIDLTWSSLNRYRLIV